MKIIRQITQADRCELRATPHAVALAAIASSVIGAIASEAQSSGSLAVIGLSTGLPAAPGGRSEARAAPSELPPLDEEQQEDEAADDREDDRQRPGRVRVAAARRQRDDRNGDHDQRDPDDGQGSRAPEHGRVSLRPRSGPFAAPRRGDAQR